ncbi:MAG: hypothetical protein QXU39_00475 [Candidatus Pacearchaeota archaeon]
MNKYYISHVIIKGHVLYLGGALSIEDAVKLAREFESKGYTYHLSEKTDENKYESISLKTLEERLRTIQSQKNKKF